MNKKTIKALCLMFTIFLSTFLINLDDVKAGTKANVGPGKGYAQCAYTWAYESSTQIGRTGTDCYRLIFKVWGTNDNGTNWFSWNHNFVRSTIQDLEKSTIGADIHETNKFVGNEDDIYGKFVNGSGNYSCPQFVCVEDGSSEGKWNFPSESEANQGSCNNNWKKASIDNYDNWTQTSNSETVNGDINVSSLQSKLLDKREDAEAAPGSTEDREARKQQIIDWGNAETTGEFQGYDNCSIISGDIITFLNNLFLIIQIIGIILLIVMSAIEFIKAITGSDEDGLKGAIKHTFIRIICIVILLLLPMLIIWILNIVNANQYQLDENGEVVIGEDNNPLCKVN